VTDEEILCEFMESRPEPPKLGQYLPAKLSPVKFWYWKVSLLDDGKIAGAWHPVLAVQPGIIYLGYLHLIEERLTDGQWQSYYLWLRDGWEGKEHPRRLLHATAQQKIKALAQVLRPEVEK